MTHEFARFGHFTKTFPDWVCASSVLHCRTSIRHSRVLPSIVQEDPYYSAIRLDAEPLTESAEPSIEGFRAGRDEVLETALAELLGTETAIAEIREMARFRDD
ncbi:MAG: hypothetical protein WD397_08040 [Wenzhouxiangellaceae bacterium]